MWGSRRLSGQSWRTYLWRVFILFQKQRTSLIANLDMIAFSLFTNIINFWCVRNVIQIPNVIRECFHQQGTAQWSMAHAIFGGLSHAMTVFQQALCCVCVFLPS